MRILNGKKSVIVPTFDTKQRKPCTAILYLENYQWTKIKDNNRIGGIGGEIFTIQNDTRVLFLGGIDDNGNKLKTIYELNENDKWMKWKQELTWPIGNDTVIQIPPESVQECKPPSLKLGKLFNQNRYDINNMNEKVIFISRWHCNER